MENDGDTTLEQKFQGPASDLEVHIAQPGDLTEEDISVLAESLVANTFDLLNVQAEEIRMTIKDEIHQIRDRAGEIFDGRLGKWSQKKLLYKNQRHGYIAFIKGSS